MADKPSKNDVIQARLDQVKDLQQQGRREDADKAAAALLNDLIRPITGDDRNN